MLGKMTLATFCSQLLSLVCSGRSCSSCSVLIFHFSFNSSNLGEMYKLWDKARLKSAFLNTALRWEGYGQKHRRKIRDWGRETRGPGAACILLVCPSSHPSHSQHVKACESLLLKTCSECHKHTCGSINV